MAATLIQSYYYKPDHCFCVAGTEQDLDSFEARLVGFWSIIIGTRALIYSDGPDSRYQTRYTMSDPNEAMRFKLMI